MTSNRIESRSVLRIEELLGLKGLISKLCGVLYVIMCWGTRRKERLIVPEISIKLRLAMDLWELVVKLWFV